MAEALGILLGIFSLVAIFATGCFFGYTFLKPIIEASKGKKATARLYTGDFFSLTMVLVLPTMLMTTVRRSNFPVALIIVIGILVYVITVWIWGRGAIKLSSIGVSNSLKRFMFLGVILPIGILGTAIGVPCLCMGLVLSLARFLPVLILLFISGFLAAALIAHGGNLACRWVLIPDEDVDGESEGEDSSTY